MIRILYSSVMMTLALTLILCGVYPLSINLAGRLFFPAAASGGILERDGHPIGARLIGQTFTRPEYLHGRASAAGANGYDASNSSGSNLGPTSQKLVKAVADNIGRVLQENPTLKKGEVPVELVTASGSGLDPHLSPEAAGVQVPRIADARKVPRAQIEAILQKHTGRRTFGFLGQPTVNVLEFNLALDREVPIYFSAEKASGTPTPPPKQD